MDISRIREAIAQRGSMSEQEPKSPGPKKPTGITFYEGGNEKTPTGKTGAYNEDYDVTPDFLNKWIKDNKFTESSNKEFQSQLLERLKSHPEYKNVIGNVEKTYGPTKAGVYDDGIFGSRTVALMSAFDEANKMSEARKKFFGSKYFVYTNPEGKVYNFGKDEESFKKLDISKAEEITGNELNIYNKLMQVKNSKNGKGNKD